MLFSLLKNHLLPRSLYGRSLLIIVTPLILLQVVSAWIFYDRHWDTVTKRLAGAVAGEVNMVIQSMRRFPGKENEERVLSAASSMNIRVAYRRGEILPNVAPEVGRGILDRRWSPRTRREPRADPDHSFPAWQARHSNLADRRGRRRPRPP